MFQLARHRYFHISTKLPRPASKCITKAGSRNLASIQPQFLAKTGSCISKDCNLDAWRFEFLLKCRRYVSQYTGCQVLWIPSRCFYHLRITAFSGGLLLLFWNKTVYCEQEVALEIIISILHSENSLYKNTSLAPGFDEEAELLLCLRDAQLPAKHGALLFM